jgi:hypothetical protein
MSFWRPSNNCIYVISDINSLHNELQLILNRILPLRRTGGQKDKLIFLGNYNSHKVIDLVIEAKSKQPDQIYCLLGSDDYLMRSAIKQNADVEDYRTWLHSGGEKILLGYLDKAESEIRNPYIINRKYINRFIPKEHIEFLDNLITYYEIDDYIFVHGGCDPFLPLENQSPDILAKDKSVYNGVINMAKNKLMCPWKKIIVTANNNLNGNFVYDKFMMLNTNVERVNVVEMNSMTGFSARNGKDRLVKEKVII